MFLTKSFNNGRKLSRETYLPLEEMLSASECRGVRYPVGTFGFLEKRWSFDRFIITTITIATNLSILSQVSDADEFSANLVMELVPLPTSTSSAMSLKLTSSWLIWLWSFWASRWVVWLIYWSPKWNVNRNWRILKGLDSGQFFTASIFLSFICRLLLTLSKLTLRRA